VGEGGRRSDRALADQLGFITAALAEPNWEVVEAAKGRLALDSIQEPRPDVVVLDLMMPEMDGFELMAARGEAGRTPGRATDQVRSHHQSYDRQGARPDDPGIVPIARRRGDRVAVR